MHEKAKCVCFIFMQPQKVKFKSVQINIKKVSYSAFRCTLELPLQPYKIQLYTFRAQGLAFSHLGSPTIGIPARKGLASWLSSRFSSLFSISNTVCWVRFVT